MINMAGKGFSDDDVAEIVKTIALLSGQRIRKEDIEVREYGKDRKLAQVREGSPSYEKYDRIIRRFEKSDEYSR